MRGRRRLKWGALGATAIASSLALLSPTKAEAQTYDIPIPLPASVDFNDVVLGATSNLRVETFASVEGGTHSRIVNLGAINTGVSFGATTGDIFSVATTSIEVGRVNGNVTCEGLIVPVPGSVVTGTLKQLTSIGRSNGPVLHAQFPTTSLGSLNVLPLQTQTLAPGRYSALNVSPGGTLNLRSGIYYFDAYVVDPLSTVIVDESAGPVEIYVNTTIQHMGTYRTPSGGAPNVFVGYFGVLPAYVGAAFPGTVVAPNAQLVVGMTVGNTTHTGTFFGQGIEVLPFTTVKHRPTDHFGIGNGNAIVASPIKTPIVPIKDPSFAPSFSGTLDPTHTYYTSLHAKPADPANGVIAPRYCDANGNQIAGPTDAQLNSAPPPGSTCPAIAANTTTCPVDPNSLTNTCITDSDCTGGAICAAKCLDTGCSQIEHRCGKQPISCGGLPAEANCNEYRICPRAGATGTASATAVAAQLPPQTTPGPDATIPPDQVDILPAYSRLDAELCPRTDPPTGEIKDANAKNGQDGSQEWGVYFQPTSEFGIKAVKTADGIGQLQDLHGAGGVAFGGIIFKNRVEVLNTQLKAVVDDCGVTLIGTVKVFGEALAVWTPSAAQSVHLATKDNDSIATPGLDYNRCTSAREATRTAITEARKANLFARETREYYSQNGLTPQLCEEIEQEIKPAPIDPDTGLRYDCNNLDQISSAGKINIINAWKTEYDAKTQSYVNFQDQLGTARQTIQVSDNIHVFDTPHPYHLKVLDQDFPLGPVTLNLAVEGFGSWNISGAIQFGIGVDGNFQKTTEILTNSLGGTAPRLGDIRAYGGPVLTPSGVVGILAYCGVGIPGVSVGIEGRVNLLDIKIPTGIVAAAMRVSEPDTRSLTGTDWDGAPKPGIVASNYRWITGFNWNANLDMSELDGQLDLAARVHFLFFSHTFRAKLFGWTGFHQNFVLVSGGSGDTLKYSGDFGKQGDTVAYTEVPAVTDNPPNVAPFGPPPATCIHPPR
ncbi:MAG TPA: hypothetical protein VHE30_14465 [Polyangiaceae bacterium]|nr:hypothetical protein [Polyangiaceae bacterium]